MFLKFDDTGPAMPRKPTTGKPRSKKLPTSRRMLTWLDRAISEANREALSAGMRELGYGSFDKSVISKINKSTRGLSADEMYAIGALTETEIPKPLSAYEMDAMRKEVRRAAGTEKSYGAKELGDTPAMTTMKEWLKEPNKISTAEAWSEEAIPGEAVSDEEAYEFHVDSEAEGETSMDANAERHMKSLVCEMLEVAGLGKEDALTLYEGMQLLARKRPSSAESHGGEDNLRKEVLALMTAFGIQQPK